MEIIKAGEHTWTSVVLPYLKRRAFIWELAGIFGALLLGRVQLLETLAPLGMAVFIAADLSGAIPIGYPLLGNILGSLLCRPVHFANICASMLYLLLRAGFRAFRGRLARWDRLFLFGLAQLLLLPVFYSGSLEAWMNGLSGLGLSLILGLCFQRGLWALKRLRTRRVLLEEEQICLCLLLGALALSVGEAVLGPVSLSICLLCFFTLFAVFAKGTQGIAAAVALGGMLTLGGVSQPVFIANLSVGALCAAICRRMGAWAAGAAFLLCAVITGVYTQGLGREIGLLNAAFAAAAFLFIPEKTVLKLSAMVDTRAYEEQSGRKAFTNLRRRISDGIFCTARTVERMAGLFSDTAAPILEQAMEDRLMIQAAGHVCAGCVRKGACWRDEEAALSAVREMLKVYQSGVKPRVAPPLDDQCRQTMALCGAAAQAEAQYRQCCAGQTALLQEQAFMHRQLRSLGRTMAQLANAARENLWQNTALESAIRQELSRQGIPARPAAVVEDRGALVIELFLLEKHRAYEQGAIACVEKALGKPLRVLGSTPRNKGYLLELEPAAALSFRVGMATVPMGGSPISGDSMDYCSLPGGRCLFALSDGMGSGPQARDQSQSTVNLLLDLYRTGFSRDAALECVNRLQKCREQESYATLDAFELDLHRGEGTFIKFGTPPAFVLRRGAVHAVCGEALPAGILEEARPAIHKARLKKDDTVILLTDGVLDVMGRDVAEEIRINIGGANTPQDGADALLSAARARGDQDDMSVLVVRVV